MSESGLDGDIPLKTSGSQIEITNIQTQGLSEGGENLTLLGSGPSQMEKTNKQTQDPSGETEDLNISDKISLKISGSQAGTKKKQALGPSKKRMTNFFREQKKQTSVKQKRNAQASRIPPSSSSSSPPCPSSPSSPSSSSTPTKKRKTNAKKTPKKTTKENEGAEQSKLKVGVQEEYTTVIFGLEMTDFNHMVASIIQIAAMPWVEAQLVDLTPTFDVYTLPICSVNPYAAEQNGFELKMGGLFQYGKRVEAVSHREGLESFLKYLRSLETPPERKKKLLVAHNASRLHSRVLVRHIESHGLLAPFEEQVIGFSDSISVFRELDPDRKISLKSYKRDYLAMDILKKFPSRHDCLENVKKIADLLNYYKASEEAVRNKSYYTGYTTLPLL